MTIAALVAGATFAGCTDDENDNKKYDEDGNEIVDEPGNTPGGDVELKEKRVARIWYGESGMRTRMRTGRCITTADWSLCTRITVSQRLRIMSARRTGLCLTTSTPEVIGLITAQPR